MGLRLPFRPREQQVLTTDEMRVVKYLCKDYLDLVNETKRKCRVSESDLRKEYHAQEILKKVAKAE